MNSSICSGLGLSLALRLGFIIIIRFYGLSKQLAFIAQLAAVHEFIQSGVEDLQWWSINNLLR